MNSSHPFWRYRKKHNLTQAGLARLLSVSPATISHIETGRRRVDPENVLPFEQRLNYEVTRHDLRPDIYPRDRYNRTKKRHMGDAA